MYKGNVVFYNPDRNFGFIMPDGSKGKIFFHYSKGWRGRSVRNVPVPVPQKGDRVVYNVREPGDTRANIWVFADINVRLNTLTPAQLELVRQVLGEEESQEWEVWNASEELAEDRRYEGREWYGAQRSGSGPRGTFYQVLLWARYYMAERGVTDPPLKRWPDMPRYTVRIKAGGQWSVINTPRYTRVQAEVFAQHVRDQDRYADVRVYDLWPDAPNLSVNEAAKVLAECGRDVLKDGYIGDSEVSWFDESWGARTEVATARFSGDNSWVTMAGVTYRGDEARLLQFCGPNLRTALN